jgi:hypothetical protein
VPQPLQRRQAAVPCSVVQTRDARARPPALRTASAARARPTRPQLGQARCSRCASPSGHADDRSRKRPVRPQAPHRALRPGPVASRSARQRAR